MKNFKAKRLNTSIRTITDFQSPDGKNSRSTGDTTSLGTDPTNTTVTIVTTVNTAFTPKG